MNEIPGLTFPLRVAATGVLLLAALLATGRAQSRSAQLQAQFEHESDPVRKAKTLSKLGSAEFQSAREEVIAGNADQALRRMERYRDEVRGVHAALRNTGVDPEKKPAGFKELQISVRESIRELGEMATAAQLELRPPFEGLRRELEVINKRLLHELFPRQPGAGKP